MELQLYCQAPGRWHPTREGGSYSIECSPVWLKATASYIRKLVGVLKYVAPLAGPTVAVAFPKYNEVVEDDVKLMEELLKKLPGAGADFETDLAEGIDETGDPEHISGAALRALRKLLDEQDAAQHWGGLKKVLTPEGHYLWLCEHHAEEYRR